MIHGAAIVGVGHVVVVYRREPHQDERTTQEGLRAFRATENILRGQRLTLHREALLGTKRSQPK